MDIGEAVHHLRIGNLVARTGWNGKRMFLFLRDNYLNTLSEYTVRDSIIEAVEQDWVAMKTAQDTVVPWLCSQSDLLANDWEVVFAT